MNEKGAADDEYDEEDKLETMIFIQRTVINQQMCRDGR